jgi:hypothetical protein
METLKTFQRFALVWFGMESVYVFLHLYFCGAILHTASNLKRRKIEITCAEVTDEVSNFLYLDLLVCARNPCGSV